VADYSFSRLKTYEQCPFKYKLIYIDKVARPPEESIESFLGDKVHKTIHKAYYDARNLKATPLDELLAHYEKLWDRDWHENIFIVKKEYTAGQYKNNGRQMISSYHNRFFPFDTEVTMDMESRIRFALDQDDGHYLTGRIDRIARAKDGAVEIHEYKTSAYLPGQYEIDRDKQLGFYHMGIQKRWPSLQQIRLVSHYLAHDMDLVSYRNEEAIQALVRNTLRLIDEIESAQEFPARKTKLCDWCEYPEYCPDKKHFYNVAELPAARYLEEPGVKLINKYAELRDQSRKIEEEMKQLKAAIVEYARKEDLAVIEGSDCYARVRIEEKLKFPAKNETERQSLNELLIRNNKWMEVSELDTFALNKIIRKKDWESDIIRQVMQYGWLEQSSTINIYKTRTDDDENEE
jgi:putative RecB family exonuclease